MIIYNKFVNKTKEELIELYNRGMNNYINVLKNSPKKEICEVGFMKIKDINPANNIPAEIFSKLQKEGINCIATTLFTVSQAVIAASVGAFGICPFISRSYINGIDPYRAIRYIKKGYSQLEKAPEIIAVSLKNTGDIDNVIFAGADAIGLRYFLIKEMMEHPLSGRAEELFARNWANVKGEDISYMNYSIKETEIAK
jgi:transaldolase